jgi:preprotein translocase subunit YajC
MNTVILEGEGNNFGFLITMALVFAVMYFFMILPQKRKRKKLEEERANIKKGDKIISIGGIHGKIVEVDEHTVVVSVEDGTKLRFDKTAITKDGSDSIITENK